MRLEQDKPVVLFEHGNLRVVGMAQDYHGNKVVLTIEESYLDALQHKSWRALDVRYPKDWVQRDDAAFEDTRDELLYRSLIELARVREQLTKSNARFADLQPKEVIS